VRFLILISWLIFCISNILIACLVLIEVWNMIKYFMKIVVIIFQNFPLIKSKFFYFSLSSNSAYPISTLFYFHNSKIPKMLSIIWKMANKCLLYGRLSDKKYIGLKVRSTCVWILILIISRRVFVGKSLIHCEFQFSHVCNVDNRTLSTF
jgi:hypothetical protein